MSNGILRAEEGPFLSPSFTPEEIETKYGEVIQALDSFNSKSSYDPNDVPEAVGIFADLVGILSFLDKEQKDAITFKVFSLYDKVSGAGLFLVALKGALKKINEVKPNGALTQVSSVKEEPETPVS